MTWLLLALSAWSQPQTCIATRFCNPGDKTCGGASPALGRKVKATDWGVAMRRFRYWTEVEITYKGRTVVAPVIDHGPYGAIKTTCATACGQGTRRSVRCIHRCMKKKRRVMTRSRLMGRYPRAPGWSYIACVDMTRAVSRKLKHNGFDWVRVRTKRAPRAFRPPGHRWLLAARPPTPEGDGSRHPHKDDQEPKRITHWGILPANRSRGYRAGSSALPLPAQLPERIGIRRARSPRARGTW